MAAAVAPEPDFTLAAQLFYALAQKTHDTGGITRASYGRDQQFVHELIT
jgi:hypothetical protein